MRVILLAILAASVTTLTAQSVLPSSATNDVQSLGSLHYSGLSGARPLNKKWSLSSFAGLSTGFGFFNGNYTSFLSAPMTLQLNRRLSDKLYAFAAVTAAPAIFNFNTFSNGLNKGFGASPMLSPNRYNLYSSVGAGVMYINDEKTFSISGSISVDRGLYSPYPYTNVNSMQHPGIGNRQ